jgi:protein SERAC1
VECAEDSSCIAITGLGGHAFGSFKEKGGQHMWLRDSLPYDLPGVRILVYGYDSHLVGSPSFQGLEALATEFRTQIAAIRRTTNVRRGMIIFLVAC